MLLITIEGFDGKSRPFSTTTKTFLDADLDLIYAARSVSESNECACSYRVEVDGRLVHRGVYHVVRNETPNLREHVLQGMGTLLMGHYFSVSMRPHLPDYDTLERDLTTIRNEA